MAIDIERTSFVIAGSTGARTVRPKCVQTIWVAHAHEPADEGRWRLETWLLNESDRRTKEARRG
jgi:hypothetical protein